MANYYDCSLRDVERTEKVGVGTGTAPDGSLRICVSLEGPAINPELDPRWSVTNWAALTPACARELYKQLRALRHLWWEVPTDDPGS